MTLAAGFGLLGHALLLAVAFVLLASRLVPASYSRLAMLIVGLLAGFLPVRGVFVVEYLRAGLGDLSVTMLLLLGVLAAALVTGRRLVGARELRAVQVALAITAVWFYPMALGLGGIDPYATGFGSTGMLTVLLAVAVAAWWARLYLLVVCITVAGGALLLGLLESTNLWDYLLDPLVSFYALGALAAQGMRRLQPDRRL